MQSHKHPEKGQNGVTDQRSFSFYARRKLHCDGAYGFVVPYIEPFRASTGTASVASYISYAPSDMQNLHIRSNPTTEGRATILK